MTTVYKRLVNDYTVCPEKKTKMFSVISSTKLGQFRWNMEHRFPNKFASKWCKPFPPQLNNVSTLPCEAWSAHRIRATVELLQKNNSRIYSTSAVASKFARFESSWLQCVRTITREGVHIVKQIYSENGVPNFIRIARVLYEILQKKTFWSFFLNTV